MFPTRREFLKTSVAGGGLVTCGLTAPAFLTRTAAAAPAAGKPGARDTILVVVQMTGGNDGLNTVIPYADDQYAKLRPTLRFRKNQVKKIDDHIGLHPSLDGLAGLLQDHVLGIVQGVGYPNPNQSHFRSMDIWQAASMTEDPAEGWLGRALKQRPMPAFHLGGSNETAPLAFAGAPVRVPSIAALDDFQLRTAAASGADRMAQRRVIEGAAMQKPTQANLLDFVRRTAVNTYASSQRLKEIGKNYQPKVPYPNSPLANHLKLAAQLISGDLGARIFYVQIDNFDTHANQATTHANLLSQMSAAMTAFYKDMASRGHKDRVLMMTFSEFGRRVHENGSQGTDHGTAAPMFLVGGKVKAGLIGAHPSLTDLAFGNLKHRIDFRQVYAAVLENWLGVPTKDVLGGSFRPADIFKQRPA
ncbi:MAG TPA: DUF1501 domain-containing protein [Gemmataceae bacterium]|nr:DUF1501 domain-containing protein [Gemmataceae bacterium]